MEYDIIASRRNPDLIEKEEVFQLIADSYSGGSKYRKGGYLYQYIRESSPSYKKRVERAVYINYVQPLADILVGFLHKTDVKRDFPPSLDDFMKEAWKGKNFDTAMKFIGVHSSLYLCGALVDSPQFDPEMVNTEADRQELGIHPYMTIYYPWQIRDFAFADDGKLLWILLDDTTVNNSNPFVGEIKEITYRLWTRETFQSFVIDVDDKGNTRISAGKDMPHPCKRVPFAFANWKEVEEDCMTDSVFEDIAYMSKAIYNYYSYIDEILASSAFKTLFFPCKNTETDLPKSVQSGGFQELTVVPYRGDLGSPKFDGPSAENIIVYTNFIMVLSKEIFRKVGQDKDEEKSGVQSGEAKRREFNRAVSLLTMGANSMETFEKEIMECALAWNADYTSEVTSTYGSEFDAGDVDAKIARLQAALQIPVFEIQKAIYKVMAQSVLKEDFKQEDMDKFMKLIEEMDKPTPPPSTNDLKTLLEAAKQETGQIDESQPGTDKIPPV